jgi:hypothetical protein
VDRLRRDKELTEKAREDVDRDVHAPPERTSEEADPRMLPVWEDEQDRVAYERAHGDRRQEREDEGHPYEGDVPGGRRVPRRRADANVRRAR